MKLKKTKLTKAEVDEIFSRMPPIPDERIQEAEDAFPQYLFYENGYKERLLECSKCGNLAFLPTDKDNLKTYGENFKILATGKHGDYANCPYCGTVAELKAEGRMKNRKSLYSTARVIFFIKANKNEFYARAAYLDRDWSCSKQPVVEYTFIKEYYFTPGMVIARDKYGNRLTAVSNPFHAVWGVADWYASGIEDLEDTFLGYWPHDEFYPADEDGRSSVYEPLRVCGDMIEYIAGMTQWPQCEKLAKLGLTRIAGDRIFRNIAHKGVINWNRQDVCGMLGLDRRELREFTNTSGQASVLETYKKLRAAGIKASFQEIENRGTYNWNKIFEASAITGETPKKIWNYLNRTSYIIGCHHGGYGEASAIDKLGEYLDYVRMADKAGWKLYRDDVKYPKDLVAAHDAANTEVQRIDAEKEKALLAEKDKKYRKLYAKLHEKYAYTNGRYCITVPESLADIKAEGKNMSHCVGGYVERHAEGSTVILFMRLADVPDRSLYTIEMNPDEWRVRQFRARKNQDPGPEARKWLDSYIESKSESGKACCKVS